MPTEITSLQLPVSPLDLIDILTSGFSAHQLISMLADNYQKYDDGSITPLITLLRECAEKCKTVEEVEPKEENE